MRTEVEAPAKINLLLRVLYRREDGYHELETVFQRLDLSDRLLIEEARETSMSCTDPSIPIDDRNLVIKAARAMQRAFGAPDVRIELQKQIPSGGGLGGGSSDAAAVLRALSQWCATPPGEAELGDLALSIGSDVPFFLGAPCAYARGRGEILRAMPGRFQRPLLLLMPPRRVSTPRAFAMLAAQRSEGDRFVPLGYDRCVEILEQESFSSLVNDLEPAAAEMLPSLVSLKAAVRSAGASLALMSGSGSTIFAAFDDRKRRDEAIRILSPAHRVVAVESAG